MYVPNSYNCKRSKYISSTKMHYLKHCRAAGLIEITLIKVMCCGGAPNVFS